MIATLAARIVIAMLGLLASATSASAECAWVLWEESVFLSSGDPEHKEWTVHAAQETRVACEAVSTAIWQVVLKSNQPGAENPGIKSVRSAPGVVVVDYKTGGKKARTFRCLPDTVDPRAPKGN